MSRRTEGIAGVVRSTLKLLLSVAFWVVAAVVFFLMWWVGTQMPN